MAWSPSTTPGCARVRLLMTTSDSLYLSSGAGIGDRSNPAPAAFGIQSSTMAPFGTKTAPNRGVAAAAEALKAGSIASRNGTATAAPTPFKKVRRGSDSFERNIGLLSCSKYVAARSHLKRHAVGDAENEGGELVLLARRISDDAADRGHVELVESPSKRIRHQLLRHGPDKHVGVSYYRVA